MFDLVIRNTQLGDIAIDGERIAEIGPELAAGKSGINAEGLTALPGLIDVHLHFNEPGRTEWEGAASGSRAFAAGGGTLFFDMPLNSSPCTVGCVEFDEKRRALESTSITDFALWGGIIPGNKDAMSDLARRGVIGFKAFMCDSGLPEFPRADDVTLYDAMGIAGFHDLPVAVHAESEEITSRLAARIIESGRHDIPAFLASRPVLAEIEAIQRAALLAREADCKLHVVHISSGRGVATALEARALGTDISIETCPHYLMFTEHDLMRIGALAKCTPPLRPGKHRDALLTSVLNGEVDIVASDHSPCPPDMKQSDNFFHIWGGFAGVQFTRASLFTKGVPADRVAALTSTNGAKRFNIKNRGTLTKGQIADIALVDLSRSQLVTEDSLFQRHRATPYMGMTLTGVSTHTIRRGEIIFQNGSITAQTKGKLCTTWD
jgi:allantoinase